MQAFFVYDAKKQQDLLIVPETDRSVTVNRVVMEEFIAVTPDFTRFDGTGLNGLPVDTFGQVIASRSTEGDVCIIDAELWQQRMAAHLGGA